MQDFYLAVRFQACRLRSSSDARLLALAAG